MKREDDEELTMDKIDDYHGKESPEKRNTIRLVIIFCIIVGIVFAYLKSPTVEDDYVGTAEKPGIDVTKK